MTRSEARKDKDFAFGENIVNNDWLWQEIKKHIVLEDGEYKLPKIQFRSSRRGKTVVSTLIIREGKARELPFRVPKEAITAELSSLEGETTMTVFEWYKSYPQKLSDEYLCFLMINDDVLDSLSKDLDIDERHGANTARRFGF